MSSQLARFVSSQSWCGAPITCTPSGIPLTAIFGKVMAGAPSAEVAALKAGSPVKKAYSASPESAWKSISGAGPTLASVMKASVVGATSARACLMWARVARAMR